MEDKGTARDTCQSISMPSRDLYSQGILCDLLKEKKDLPASSKGANTGLRPRHINYAGVYELMEQNSYHAACMRAKVSATVGQGFESPADRKRKRSRELGIPLTEIPTPEEEIAKADAVLNPLCRKSLRHVMTTAAWDFHSVGWGAIEVVRAGPESNSPILAIHPASVVSLFAYIEDSRGRNYHYQNMDETGGTTLLADFGDLARLTSEVGNGFAFGSLGGSGPRSEIIAIVNPYPKRPYYGGVTWLSAVPPIELAKMLTQNEFDFYNNRACPEFIAVLFAANLTTDAEGVFKEALNNTLGQGNQRKSTLLTLNNPDAKFDIHKLGMESTGESSAYAVNSVASGVQIVTAHGVPPLLAGVQIPGKMGAANETVQAMQSFQSLEIGPAQSMFQQALGMTLGNSSCNGGLDLTVSDFAFNTIVDTIDVSRADTIARMRQSPQEAQAEGRNIDDGLKD